MAAPLTLAERPRCPNGCNRLAWRNGYERQWSENFQRQRYKCPLCRKNFTWTERQRHPTELHPHSGEECPTCEHVYDKGMGLKGGHGYLFAAQEIARTLIAVGQGTSLRRASADTRGDVWRPRRADVRRSDGDYSSEASLARDWVDVFGPVILEDKAFRVTRWPRAVSIDATELRGEGLEDDPNRPGAGRQMQRGNPRGYVVVAIDETAVPPVPCLITLMGSKDEWSWREILDSLEGQPDYLVADQEPGLVPAVADRWAGVTFYNSEAHLRRNGEAYLEADQVPEFVVRQPGDPDYEEDEPDDSIPEWARRRRKAFRRHDLWQLLRQAQWNVETWDAFKAAVETAIPAERKQTRDWIKRVEPKVLEQMLLRRQYPGMERSTGNAEVALDWIKQKFSGRTGRFGNLRRVNLILGLMRLHLARADRDIVYTGLIRTWFRGHDGGSGMSRPRYKGFYDSKARSNTVDQLFGRARARGAFLRAQQQDAAVTERLKARKQEMDERARAAGQPTGGWHRKPPTEKFSVAGKFVTDAPSLLEEWDYERNPGLDPAKVRLSHNMKVNWICRAHENDPDRPHVHRWAAQVYGRARNQSRCPFCANRQLCELNNLGWVWKDIASEWDWEHNPAPGPEGRFPGEPVEVMWLCPSGRGHPPYPQRIDVRTRWGRGCPIETKEDWIESRRAKWAEAERDSRKKAAVFRKALEDGVVDDPREAVAPGVEDRDGPG